MAEWEESSAVTITWTSYTDVLTEIVRHAKDHVQVIINCADSIQVTNQLASNGVDTENVTFIETNYNSIWIRDYGPNNVYLNDVDSLVLVDWIYNRPRPADDAIPQGIADKLGLVMFETTASPNDLTHTGGNFMADGFGTGFSSELIIEENTDKSESEIDAIMENYMGIDRYIKMPTLPYDGIHHIDMHMKLLDEETLLVGEYPEGTADGPQIEANLEYVLANYNSVYGTPYKVIRIPMPDDNGNYPNGTWSGGDYRTYANAIILNTLVLLPIYEHELDAEAISIWEEALPGYEVVGIDCREIIQASGAIHCITHEIGVTDPLLIRHQALNDTEDTVNDYTVEALVKHKSGIASATLYYKTDINGSYTSVAMTDAGSDMWTADIPAQAVDTDVYYYVHAEANSGKQQNRPMSAPEGYWTFHVGGLDIGVEENNVDLADVFPNPASGITCIPANFKTDSKVNVSLYDMLGNHVATIYNGQVPSGTKKFFFNAQDYASGSYLITVESNNGRFVKPIMIK